MKIIENALDRRRERRRPRCAAIIAAAGTASRMHGVDKLRFELDGEPVLLRTLRTFEECACIDEIVVVTREDLLLWVNDLCRAHELKKVSCVLLGGEERIDSVLAGLDSVHDRVRLAAIHDGARPLVTGEIITRAVEKAAKTGAAAPAIPVKDTVKVTRQGVIETTPERDTLMAVQTPQVFDVDLVRGALYKARQEGISLTDDCAAVERLGMNVHLTEGSEENLKLTTPIDLDLAAAILERRKAQ